jgi:hypothetical protein
LFFAPHFRPGDVFRPRRSVQPAEGFTTVIGGMMLAKLHSPGNIPIAVLVFDRDFAAT